MENITDLKEGKRLPKNLYAWIQNTTTSQLLCVLLLFLFSRASFFDVLRPFALAFYCAAPMTILPKILSITAIFIGNLMSAGLLETVRQLGALLIFEAILYYWEYAHAKRMSLVQRAVLMCLTVLATGLIRGLFQGLHLYDVITSVLMAALVFSLAVLTGPGAEELNKQGKIRQDTRIIAAKLLIILFIVLSLENLVLLNFHMSDIAAGIAVLIYARRKGSAWGAMIGAAIGFMLAIFRLPGSMALPGLFAMAGAAAGLPFKSKTASVALYSMVTFIFAGISILENSLITEYYSVLASGILFLLIPNSWLSKISDFFAGYHVRRKTVEDSEARRTSHEAADKLYILGKALSRVSRSLSEYIEDEASDERTMAESVIETVAERVCNRCAMCERCWGTHFMKTYKLVEKAVSNLKVDEAGILEIPVWFRNTCARNEKFFESLGIAYSLYKAERIWHMQLNETRELISRQAGVIAGSVMSMARAMVESSAREDEMEMELLRQASGMGIPVADIRLRLKNGHAMDVVCENHPQIDLNALDQIVKDRLGSHVVRVGETRRDLMGYSVMRYIRQPKFKTITGVARIGREDETVSGDSFTFFLSSNAFHVSAISDGSGSGKRAERYSRTAIQMLEYLIEDGVELSLAIKLLNIYLCIRGEDEPLATLDVSAINLLTGETSVYKLGAPLSFIKSKSGISAIPRASSEEADETQTQGVGTLEDGDLLIMVSDGVSQAFYGSGETALMKYLASIETINPQQMADQILTEARAIARDVRDDMTVLVTRLW